MVPTSRWCGRLVWASVAFVAVTGVVTGAGWAFPEPEPLRLWAGRPVTGPAGAVGLVLAALALGLLAPPRAPRARRALGRVAGGAVTGVGAWGLAEHVAGRGLGPGGQFADEIQRPGGGVAGRTPVLVAVLFMVCGLALVLLNAGRRERIGTAFLVLSLVLVSSTLLGYVGDGVPAGPSRIAAQTPIALLVLLVGVVAARPDGMMMRAMTSPSPSGLLLRRAGPALMVPLVLVIVLPAAIGAGTAGAGMAGGGMAGGDLLATGSTSAVILIMMGALLATGRLLDRAATRQQAEVRQHERHLAAVLNGLHEGVMLFDSKRRIIDVNPRLCELVGRSREQVIGLGSPLPWWHPTMDRQALEQGFQDLVSGAVTRHAYEQIIVRPDGSPLVAAVVIGPAAGAGAEPASWVATVSDITDRVRAGELQREVEQLRRLDSLGKLAGGVAHDFNNLLMVIGGHARLLAKKLPPASPLRDGVLQIVGAAEKGDALTRQLLAFGRGGMSRDDVLDVTRIVADLQPLLHATLGEHIALRIPAEPEGTPCLVRGERAQLEQVLINLAANARDAMPDAGTLSITCTRLDRIEDPPGSGQHHPQVRLAVSDTGHGMEAEVQARVFEPFFTTKASGEGTGLGLSTVYGIVKNAGGRVRLRSRPGHGTEFEILLPATDQQAEQPAAVPPATTPPPARILVAEDQPEVADLVAQILTEAGLHPTVMTDPRQALSAVAAGLAVDLLLTDVIMAAMDGPELAAAVRHHRPALPVLYMSGYGGSALEQASLTDETMVISKPFSPEVLLTAVAAALDRAALDKAALDRAALDSAALDSAALDRAVAVPGMARAGGPGASSAAADR